MVPPAELTPVEQTERCLSAEHLACDRYLAARRVVNALDHELVSTRLVVAGRRRSPAGAPTVRHGTVIAAAGGGLVAATVAGAVWWASIEEPRGAVLSGSARAAREAAAGDSGGTTPRTTPPSASPTGSPAQLGGVEGASPPASPAATPAPTPAVPTPTPVRARYEVQPGDTLNAIAAAFDTSAAEIMALNGLQSDVIEIGQVLVIP